MSCDYSNSEKNHSHKYLLTMTQLLVSRTEQANYAKEQSK